MPVRAFTCIPRHVIFSAGLSNFLRLIGRPKYDNRVFNDKKSLEAL